MDFDSIKSKMESESMEDFQVPNTIGGIVSSRMPIQQVKKSMKYEIVTQLACIVGFFLFPLFVQMHPLPRSIYYLLMFITSLITLGYLAKMTWFLNKFRSLNEGSKDTVVAFINDLKLTLEVYKTAIIAGSLLLPFSISALALGLEQFDEKIFTDLILLNIPSTMLLLILIGYVITAILFYFVTVAWCDKLYGIHVKTLEQTLQEFDN
jgi:hypothetical protein